jgi:surface carbohydrate biosynthesis protein
MRDRTRPSVPRLAIIVDHPQRDLGGLVLTAMELAGRGFLCHLVPLNIQEREIWAFEPDFVLFNFLRRSNEDFARELQRAGIQFGVLDTEGAIWPNPEEYVSLLWKDPALLREVRCVCMWGSLLADHLLARGIFTRDQIVVTGCPRFDLYAAEWRRLSDDGPEAGAKLTGTILINTNFSISNPRFTTREKCIEMHRNVLGYSDAELRRMVGAEDIAIPETVQIADRLSRQFPDVTVVVRPHPFENPAPYEAAARHRPNLTVNDTESIQAAIFRARAVIQRSCTTAIEAGLAGVPTFSPQWLPAPMLMPAAEAASVPCASWTELSGYLSAVLGGSYQTPAAVRQSIDEVISSCCYSADGRSYRRASDAVERLLRPTRTTDSVQCRRALYRLDPSGDGALLARLGRHARHRLSLSPEWSFARMGEVPATEWMASRKHFDEESVRALVDRAQLCAPFVSTKRNVGVSAGGRSPGRQTRYGVTIAPRNLLPVPETAPARTVVATDAEALSR